MRKLLIPGALSFVFIVVFMVWTTFRTFVYAAAWHREHGDYTELAGHRVKLPPLWWQESDGIGGTPAITRAHLEFTGAIVELTATPKTEEEIVDTDQHASEALKKMTAVMNRTRSTQFRSSSVQLSAKPFNLFCRKDDLFQDSDLSCMVPKLPYSIRYIGRSKWEKEAEAILSSIE